MHFGELLLGVVARAVVSVVVAPGRESLHFSKTLGFCRHTKMAITSAPEFHHIADGDTEFGVGLEERFREPPNRAKVRLMTTWTFLSITT